MFSSGTTTSLEESGVAEDVLFPKTFMWPYGGTRVYVTGTFTRWSDHVPMSPVEGWPTLFQATCRLTPGMHQYKFYVDGEWRHDEHQPSMTGSYGTVNTISVTREPDSITSLLNLGALGSRNMNVDNDTFLPMVTGSGFSNSDVEVSLHCILEFLSSHSAYDLLPDSGKVIALDVNLPVKQAFHILYEQGIPVAPLWDFSSGKFVGVLSPTDFILILRELRIHGSNLTEEELETHTIAAWKGAKHQNFVQPNSNGESNHRSLVFAGPYDSLKDVALKILQNDVSTTPIIHSSLYEGSFPQLLHLASLSGILNCICRYFRHSSHSLPILQKPICSLPLGTWVPKIGESNRKPLAMLGPDASLSSALSLLIQETVMKIGSKEDASMNAMVVKEAQITIKSASQKLHPQAQVSSIPVVNHDNSLLDIYSRSDITALAKDKAYTRFHLHEISVYQAFQLGQDATMPNGFFKQRCHMCLRSDPLQTVMERLASPGVRRVVVVEAGSKQVEGIVSLGDVFRFFLGLL